MLFLVLAAFFKARAKGLTRARLHPAGIFGEAVPLVFCHASAFPNNPAFSRISRRARRVAKVRILATAQKRNAPGGGPRAVLTALWGG